MVKKFKTRVSKMKRSSSSTPQLTEEEWLERLAIEAQELRREEPTFRPVKGDLTKWRGEIIGSGLYEDGVFVVEIQIPRTFPFTPPMVKWLTPTWHPNIYKDRVCVSILGKEWVPTNSLVDVVEALRVLLSNPNPLDPLNGTAAQEAQRQPEVFKRKVKEYIKKYATWDEAEKWLND